MYVCQCVQQNKAGTKLTTITMRINPFTGSEPHCGISQENPNTGNHPPIQNLDIHQEQNKDKLVFFVDYDNKCNPKHKSTKIEKISRLEIPFAKNMWGSHFII